MAHNQEIINYLEQWRSKRFRPREITFAEAAKSLEAANAAEATKIKGSEDPGDTTEDQETADTQEPDIPLIIARPVGSNHSRWMVSRLQSIGTAK